MFGRRGLVVVLVLLAGLFGATRASAEDEPASDEPAEVAPGGAAAPAGATDDQPGSADDHAGSADDHAGSADDHAGSADDHAGSADDHAGSADDHAGSADDHAPPAVPPAPTGGADDLEADEAAAAADVDINAVDSDGDGTPDSLDDGDIDNDGIPDASEEDPPTDPFDADGDGRLEPDEVADRAAFAGFYDDVPNAPDDKALEARPAASELVPTITADQFRIGVRLVKNIVLAKMSAKIAKKADKNMRTFALIVCGTSLLGLLLLFMPLVLAKKYPGQGKLLATYSALAAVTFVVTVNLFGGVLFGMKTVQGALSNFTNPSIAIAAGTFDTLDDNAEDYLTTGRELFLPTLEQLRNNPDEQPAVQLLENGTRIVQDAKVFLTVASAFKKVDFLFGMLPIILTLVTLILFILAIRPTLTEIIKLPAMAAAGTAGVGKEVVAGSMRRIKGELLATLCTIGVLTVLTVGSAFVLGRIVKPAIETLLGYFSLTITYLQFREGASSTLVFVTLFAVIFFLALNLATLILSMSFFLGKSQKIFQQRFNVGTPLANHRRFFTWGAPAVALVQVFPWLFMLTVAGLLDVINDKLTAGAQTAEAISWGRLLLAGPLFLVLAFLVLFWALRGVKALRFLQSYKVVPKAPKATEPASSAQA